jgi:DNA-binding NarL/FixJ family response regulator
MVKGIFIMNLCHEVYQIRQMIPAGYLSLLFTIFMEFKQEELVEREIEIASYLAEDFTLKMIATETGISKKILTAHLRNMMKKLNAAEMDELIKIVKKRGG